MVLLDIPFTNINVQATVEVMPKYAKPFAKVNGLPFKRQTVKRMGSKSTDVAAQLRLRLKAVKRKQRNAFCTQGTVSSTPHLLNDKALLGLVVKLVALNDEERKQLQQRVLHKLVNESQHGRLEPRRIPFPHPLALFQCFPQYFSFPLVQHPRLPPLSTFLLSLPFHCQQNVSDEDQTDNAKKSVDHV